MWFSGGSETRRGTGVIVMVASTILPCPPYSVLSESNECNDLNANAIAIGETRSTRSVFFLRTEARRGDVGYWNDC